MCPREDESSSCEVDYSRRESVETMLCSQVLCEDDDHCMSPSDLEELRKLDGNDFCIDCGLPDPDWASVSLGIFMCLECSGIHRSLGTHISKVRSVRMDSWTGEQIALMKLGGNKQCVKFLKQHGLRRHHHTIAERYDCAAAMWYQQILKARREGQAEPTEMPDYTPARRLGPKRDSIQGIGSPRNLMMNKSLSGSFHSFATSSSAVDTATMPPESPSLSVSFHDKGKLMAESWQEKGKQLEAAVLNKAIGFFQRISASASGTPRSSAAERKKPVTSLEEEGADSDKEETKTGTETASEDGGSEVTTEEESNRIVPST